MSRFVSPLPSKRHSLRLRDLDANAADTRSTSTGFSLPGCVLSLLGPPWPRGPKPSDPPVARASCGRIHRGMETFFLSPARHSDSCACSRVSTRSVLPADAHGNRPIGFPRASLSANVRRYYRHSSASLHSVVLWLLHLGAIVSQFSLEGAILYLIGDFYRS